MPGTLIFMLVLSVVVRAREINKTYDETGFLNETVNLNETVSLNEVSLNETVSLNITNVVNTTKGTETIQPDENDRYSDPEPRQLPIPLLPLLSTPPIMLNAAFSVRKATPTLGALNRIQFQDVLTNVGGGWDPTTSEFVAPYNGGYFFIFHAVGARNSDFTMALTKNGVYQVTAYGTQNTFEHGSNSIFLYLRRLDRIFLQLQQGLIFEHPGNEAYTAFNGFSVYRA